jgi:hypothetical protein
MSLNLTFFRPVRLLFVGLALFVFAGGAGVRAETLYATTVNNNLISFDSADPCSILSEVRITGLQPEEDVLGIDFRPATGQLYALGSTSRLYTIDLVSGLATAVGTGPFTPALSGSSFGFDFNPTVDRIRVVSDTGQNLRLNPITGATAATDVSLAYASGDANNGIAPTAVGAAYTNPDRDPATGTTLYDIDSALDILALQNPPNNGTLNTIGPLTIGVNDVAGFDISTTNTAYAAFIESGRTRTKGRRCGTSSLATINLMNGTATVSGAIGTPQPIRGLAAFIAAPAG